MPIRRKGLTLIEVLIIVVMIGVLLTLVFQKIRGRTETDEVTTIGTRLRDARSAETSYSAVHNRYGTLAQLDSARLLDAAARNAVTIRVVPNGYTIESTNGPGGMICTLTVAGGEAGAATAEPVCHQ